MENNLSSSPSPAVTTPISAPVNETSKTEKPLSKNQIKKMRRLEIVMKNKAEKRKKERELRKLKGKNGRAIIEHSNGEITNISRKSLKQNIMSNSTNKLRVVIDCSFEELMNFNDINHLGKQLSYCYATNRRMTNPLQFYVTSFKDKTKEQIGKTGITNWDVHLSDLHFIDLFKDELKESICYLTSDSPNELESFDERKIYIIGGLVDHNHHKSLCYNLAVKNELSHARLPINKFLDMKSRKVLTVNHVFQIISKYVECKDWKTAFISCLPKRKNAEAKSDDEADDKEKDLKLVDDNLNKNESEESSKKKLKSEDS